MLNRTGFGNRQAMILPVRKCINCNEPEQNSEGMIELDEYGYCNNEECQKKNIEKTEDNRQNQMDFFDKTNGLYK